MKIKIKDLRNGKIKEMEERYAKVLIKSRRYEEYVEPKKPAQVKKTEPETKTTVKTEIVEDKTVQTNKKGSDQKPNISVSTDEKDKKSASDIAS